MRNQKIQILKFIDHWVGGPICIFLSVIFRLSRPFYKTHLNVVLDKTSPKKILIIKFFGLGSITLASSILLSIRESCENTKIYFLTFKENKNILDQLSIVDRVLIIDPKNPLVLLITIFQTMVFCYREKIDVAMDIEFYSKFSTIMTFLSGAPWRMGFYMARFWRNSLINVPIYFNYSRHVLEIYSMFSKALGIENPKLYPQKILINDQDREELMMALKSFEIYDLQGAVGLNIHASDLAFCRRWSPQKFATLVRCLLVEYPMRSILLTGGKNEMTYSQAFLEQFSLQERSRIVDLTGKITLKQFLTLLSKISLFITNDTGPFHLAKAVGAKTVSLWGPGSIDLYGPFKNEKNDHSVVYKRFPCSPCLYVYRTDAGYFCNGKAPCMEAITPDDVMMSIHHYLRI